MTSASSPARGLFTQTGYETSPYRSDTQYVTDLYYTYLQRGPDDSGLGWWVGQLSNGRPAVCNAFEGSSEFATLVATLYGTATSDNQRTELFVNNFYRGAYGRDGTTTEIQTQRDALNAAAAQGQSQVQAQAETFGRSLFAAQVSDYSISDQQFVTNLYESFLQRGPDAGGLGFWTSIASGGSSNRQNVLNAFATCGSFYALADTLYREEFWLVTDHLGTPRLIVDKSGSLASVRRHDYLPFGEEIYANTGGRSATQGYAGDSTRQRFTGYEADSETGLNFAQARYQSSVQGRFTSVDPLSASASLVNPQSLNRYSYVQNNPTNFTDPSGMMLSDIGVYQTDIEAESRFLERHMVEDFRNAIRPPDPPSHSGGGEHGGGPSTASGHEYAHSVSNGPSAHSEDDGDAEVQGDPQTAIIPCTVQVPTDANDRAVLATLMGEAAYPGTNRYTNATNDGRGNSSHEEAKHPEGVVDWGDSYMEMEYMVSVFVNRHNDNPGHPSWYDDWLRW